MRGAADEPSRNSMAFQRASPSRLGPLMGLAAKSESFIERDEQTYNAD